MTGQVCGPYAALAHTFTVDVTRASAVLSVIDSLLSSLPSAGVGAPPTAYRVAPAGTGFELLRDGDRLFCATTAEQFVSLLAWEVNRAVIATTTPHRTLLHAAAATRNGRAVLLPAPAQSGKTTTVAGLLRSGWSYLTDEAVAVDGETLELLPYPKALKLDPASWLLFSELLGDWTAGHRHQHVSPDRLRPGSAAVPTRVGLVVFPSYKRGAATCLDARSPGQALLAMAESTFQFPSHGHRNLRVLSNIARSCPAYSLTIGSLAEAVRLIDEVMVEVMAA